MSSSTWSLLLDALTLDTLIDLELGKKYPYILLKGRIFVDIEGI